MERGEGGRGPCGGLRAFLTILMTESSLSLGIGPFSEPTEQDLAGERDKQEAEQDFLGIASLGGKGTELGFTASGLYDFLVPGGGP